jgi:hypothetical protein
MISQMNKIEIDLFVRERRLFQKSINYHNLTNTNELRIILEYNFEIWNLDFLAFYRLKGRLLVGGVY